MISILMPVYNVERYIKESIDSILNSSHKNFELIIINDGSKDNTVEIIKQFSDNRIKLFNKKNSGIIETLNYGIQKCKSSIIMRMDGDDIIHPRKIKSQLSFFKKSGSLLSGTNGYLIDADGNKRGQTDLPIEHNNIIKSMLKMSPSFIHPSVMYYKDAVLKVGGYDLNFKHAEDFDLFLRLSKIGNISNIADRLIYLRKHDNNISLLNAEEQIRNTIISRDIYKHYNYNQVNKFIYPEFRQRVEDDFLKKLYIKVHSLIAAFENKDFKKTVFVLFFLKVFRKALNFFI